MPQHREQVAIEIGDTWESLPHPGQFHEQVMDDVFGFGG
jgi:hypothetical protein